MAVCPQHLLLSRRLLRYPWIPQMVSDPPVHDFEGRLDCRGLHAHGLGAAGPDVCHSGPASVGVGVCGHHGVRIELHAFHSDYIFWGGVLAVKPQEVIPGQTESADRWLACEANMRPVPVVAMEPSGQRGISLL